MKSNDTSVSIDILYISGDTIFDSLNTQVNGRHFSLVDEWHGMLFQLVFRTCSGYFFRFCSDLTDNWLRVTDESVWDCMVVNGRNTFRRKFARKIIRERHKSERIFLDEDMDEKWGWRWESFRCLVFRALFSAEKPFAEMLFAEWTPYPTQRCTGRYLIKYLSCNLVNYNLIKHLDKYWRTWIFKSTDPVLDKYSCSFKASKYWGPVHGLGWALLVNWVSRCVTFLLYKMKDNRSWSSSRLLIVFVVKLSSFPKRFGRWTASRCLYARTLRTLLFLPCPLPHCTYKKEASSIQMLPLSDSAWISC